MAMSLLKSHDTNLLSLFRELRRIDLKLKEKVAEARSRDKYWQNNSIRGLFISEAEITDLLSKPLDEKLISRSDVNNEVSNVADSPPVPGGAVSRLEFLAQKFSFSAFEKDLVLLAILPELDLTYERLFGYIQDDVTRRKPSIGLTLDLLSSTPTEKIANRKVFSNNSALINNHIIEIQEEINRKNSPLLSNAIRIDERIRDYLLGSDDADASITAFASIVEPAMEIEHHVAPELVKRNLLHLLDDTGKHPQITLYFWGLAGSGRRSLVDALCFNNRTKYLKVDMPLLLSSNIDFGLACVLLNRESFIRQIPVFYHNFDVLFAEDHRAELNGIMTKLETGHRSAPVFMSGTSSWKPRMNQSDQVFVQVELSIPDFDRRRQIWQSQLAAYNLKDSKLEIGLSSKFKMNIGEIRRSISMAHSNALYGNRGQVKEGDLYDACRRISSHKLNELAQKISTRYTWDDIVLPTEQMTQLREICDHVKYRHIVYNEWGFDRKISLGKGLNALFAGPSGTGKTMSSEIMANELNLDLYKIDLSSIVSKYIGETEKNLSHIFKEAENSNSILFFDEADSLFGKRSEVRDSHDRYANIEIAYLLQKMEEYEGIVILATNLGKNIDEAFARRMHFAIEFPFPGEEQCLQIWKKVFPANAPTSNDIDIPFMARQFRISGGNIKNIALTAAFFAASEEKQISMDHIILATKREYQKMGKLCTASEFGKYL
jgi:ATP-dependent 26S proteasome regulatory subunit